MVSTRTSSLSKTVSAKSPRKPAYSRVTTGKKIEDKCLKLAEVTGHFWTNLINTHDGENGLVRKVIGICQELAKNQGVHSNIAMKAAGFRYTGVADTARCDTCGLEVSGWTLDMKPFTIHAQCNPKCAYVLSILPDGIIPVPITMNVLTTTSAANTVDEKPTKRQKTEAMQEICQSNILVEVESLKGVRRRTFSHWPHRESSSSIHMSEAGFFSCDVNDRVICLYCNLICQEWVSNTDNPWEVHKTLSPKCPYVTAVLKRQRRPSLTKANIFQENQEPIHKKYTDARMRSDSFATWPNENLPSVDDLVRAGFFYTGTKTIVTCFHCNGNLRNWGANDNPVIEHARWFPHCAYAKQLCGAELHRRIQEHQQRPAEYNNYHESNTGLKTGDMNSNSESLQPSDNHELSSHIAARLDLPISRELLARNIKLSIIRRCWENQLLHKHSDFTNDSELLVACWILEKQIELGVEEGKNIIIPSKHMSKLRNQAQTGSIPLNRIDNFLP